MPNVPGIEILLRISSSMTTRVDFRKNGERTEEAFSKISVPDYGSLLNPGFWLTWNTLKIVAKE